MSACPQGPMFLATCDSMNFMSLQLTLKTSPQKETINQSTRVNVDISIAAKSHKNHGGSRPTIPSNANRFEHYIPQGQDM